MKRRAWDCCERCMLDHQDVTLRAPRRLIAETTNDVRFTYQCRRGHRWVAWWSKGLIGWPLRAYSAGKPRALGHCRECGGALTDPLSVAAEHGPTCSRRVLASR